MKKERILLIWIFLIFIYMISLVSADIFLTQQPKDIYNIGDEMSLILGSDGVVGWAGMNLICGNYSQMIYFHYLSKSETNNPVTIPLTKEFLKGSKGDCYISMIFDNAKKNSFPFVITDRIEVSVSMDKISLYPNESFSFKGSTKKANGQEFNGIVDINFESLNIQNSVPVEKDEFQGSFSLPGDIASGDYKIGFFVSEKNIDGEIINLGSASSSINVLQKPTKLVIETQSKIVPGNPINFKAELYDQANVTIEKKPVALTLSNPEGKKVYDKLLFTGESNSFNLLTSSPFGSWNINAVSEGLTERASIFVEKYRLANYSITNNTLTILNIGNVPFDKPVEIRIGNYSEIKYLNLSMGGYAELFLEAPDGNYNISISDGYSEFLSNTPLTGKVVSIRDKNYKGNTGFGFFKNNFFAWIFLLLILGSFIFLTTQKVINRRFKVTNKQSVFFNNKPEETKGGVVKLTPPLDKSPEISKFNESHYADHSLEIHGEKQQASLLALKIKNMSSFDTKKSNINERINEITKEIFNNKGKLYRSNDFIIGIFAPVVTRTFDNSLNAIKTANSIASKIKSDNNKFNQKINFGIAVSDGDIVARKQDGKLVFTPLGSGFLNAKKIAEISKSDLLISESTNKKVMSKVKTSFYSEESGIKTYLIKEIVDKQENKKFIEGFLKRNNESKHLRDFRTEGLKNESNEDSLDKHPFKFP